MEKRKLKEEIIELLKQILETMQSNKNEKVTFTVVEASEYSGIGQLKIRELIERANTDFPFFKVGVKASIDKRSLDRWLEKITEEHRSI